MKDYKVTIAFHYTYKTGFSLQHSINFCISKAVNKLEAINRALSSFSSVVMIDRFKNQDLYPADIVGAEIEQIAKVEVQ